MAYPTNISERKTKHMVPHQEHVFHSYLYGLPSVSRAHFLKSYTHEFLKFVIDGPPAAVFHWICTFADSLSNFHYHTSVVKTITGL